MRSVPTYLPTTRARPTYTQAYLLFARVHLVQHVCSRSFYRYTRRIAHGSFLYACNYTITVYTCDYVLVYPHLSVYILFPSLSLSILMYKHIDKYVLTRHDTIFLYVCVRLLKVTFLESTRQYQERYSLCRYNLFFLGYVSIHIYTRTYSLRTSR